MACPLAVRFDPFGTGRYSFRKWQVENADLLALRASAANCDDLLRRGDIYAFDGNWYTEYLRLKRQSEIVPDHRGKSLDKNNIGSRARPFASCGKLALMCRDPSRGTRRDACHWICSSHPNGDSVAQLIVRCVWGRFPSPAPLS